MPLKQSPRPLRSLHRRRLGKGNETKIDRGSAASRGKLLSLLLNVFAGRFNPATETNAISRVASTLIARSLPNGSAAIPNEKQAQVPPTSLRLSFLFSYFNPLLRTGLALQFDYHHIETFVAGALWQMNSGIIPITSPALALMFWVLPSGKENFLWRRLEI